MLTGTPLDLTPFGPLVGALGIAYWLLAFGLDEGYELARGLTWVTHRKKSDERMCTLDSKRRD